jgi:hypothetical protein
MQLTKKLLSILLLSFILNKTFGQEQPLATRYITKGYNAGVLVTFASNQTFTYRYRGHISSDTAAGKYSQVGDTIVLNYEFNNYQAIYAAYKAKNENVPIDIQLSAGRAILRPFKLYKKRKRLYYIDETNGKFKTYKVNGKTRKVYMQLYR